MPHYIDQVCLKLLSSSDSPTSTSESADIESLHPASKQNETKQTEENKLKKKIKFYCLSFVNKVRDSRHEEDIRLKINVKGRIGYGQLDWK